MSDWKYEINDGLVAFYEDGIERDVDKVFDELNAAESRIAKLEAEVTKGQELQDSYCDRIAELEGLIDKLIEASKKIYSWASCEDYKAFYALVDDWKEREE